MAIFSIWLTPAIGAAGCHTALVLALDASDSVDAHEAALQRQGIAAALQDPVIRAAISPAPGEGVMLTAFEWANPGETQTLAPWTFLASPAAIDAAAAQLGQPAPAMSGQTGLGAALKHATDQFAALPRPCDRHVIDVSGDGPGNIGVAPRTYRNQGHFEGVTINGLVIRNPAFDSAQPPGHDPLTYYQAEVKYGPGAFVIEIRSYEDYAAGIRTKLLRELSPSMAAR